MALGEWNIDKYGVLIKIFYQVTSSENTQITLKSKHNISRLGEILNRLLNTASFNSTNTRPKPWLALTYDIKDDVELFEQQHHSQQNLPNEHLSKLVYEHHEPISFIILHMCNTTHRNQT